MNSINSARGFIDQITYHQHSDIIKHYDQNKSIQSDTITSTNNKSFCYDKLQKVEHFSESSFAIGYIDSITKIQHEVFISNMNKELLKYNCENCENYENSKNGKSDTIISTNNIPISSLTNSKKKQYHCESAREFLDQIQFPKK